MLESAARLAPAFANLLIAQAMNQMQFSALSIGWRESAQAKIMFFWETIDSFGSLRERDSFLAWMRDQIAQHVAEEIEAPADVDPGERWFRHIPTGSTWRLVPVENPYGPGFWPVYDAAAA